MTNEPTLVGLVERSLQVKNNRLIRSSLLIEHRLVTDRHKQTQRQTDTRPQQVSALA